MKTEALSALIANLTPLSPIKTDAVNRIDKRMRVRAVLFDVYGTLLISGTGDVGITSLETSNEDVCKIFIQSGYSIADRTNLPRIVSTALREVIGHHHRQLRAQEVEYPEVDIREVWSEVLTRLWENGYLAGKPDHGILEELAFHYENLVNPVWPMPGFPHIIHQFRQEHFKLGIVSNAQFYTPILLEALTDCSLADLGFEDQFCAWSYLLREAKPSSAIFTAPLRALKSIGILPHEILFVGNDMLNDISAASKAGCRTCLFAGDKRSLKMRNLDKRMTAEPDMVITDLNLLECLLDKGG